MRTSATASTRCDGYSAWVSRSLSWENIVRCLTGWVKVYLGGDVSPSHGIKPSIQSSTLKGLRDSKVAGKKEFLFGEFRNHGFLPEIFQIGSSSTAARTLRAASDILDVKGLRNSTSCSRRSSSSSSSSSSSRSRSRSSSSM